MERLTRKIRRQLLDRFGDSVRPLTKKQIEWCRKDTARYIWFNDKDAFNGHCERCDKDVTFDKKTRHKEYVRCPKCKQKLEIRHSWRVTKTDNVDFRVITTVPSKDEVFMRYILIDQDGQDKTIKEVAREIMNFATQTRREMEKQKHGWDFGKSQRWFQIYNMYEYRRYCCLMATPYIPGLEGELKKLDRIKYLENKSQYVCDEKYFVSSSIRSLAEYAGLLEKFEKSGHKGFAQKFFSIYLGSYSWSVKKMLDLEQTSLVKMMKLNKGNFKRWEKYEDLNSLEYLQKHPMIQDDVLDYVIKNHIDINSYESLLETNIGHMLKALKYVTENKLNIHEYSHYVYMLSECGYKMDKAYLFPKDFRKEDKRLSDEYKQRKDEITLKTQIKNNTLIKSISEGLQNMEDLKEFMGGSNGLLVHVPDSTKELYEEGKSLHNCIGTYADRIAKNKTLVFFVRKLNAPNEPFVAFEYCNGEVVQCRYDHNQTVKGDTEDGAKIINFVDAFAKRLRKNKVLCAA